MPYREIGWNIPYEFLVYILGLIAVGVMAYSIYRRYKIWHIGKGDDRPRISRLTRTGIFIRTAISDGLAHRRFFREPYPGIMHFTIFWGCLILLIATALDAITTFTNRHITGVPYLWFSVISDSGGFLVLIGFLMAAYRRYVIKPKRLNTILDDGVIIVLAVAILITGYLIEGFRIAINELGINPDWAVWSPGGLVVARLVAGLSSDSLLFWHRFLWWFHVFIAVGTGVYVGLAFSKIQHLFIAPLNVFWRTLTGLGSPAPIDIEKAESLGVASIRDFTWKQLLDLDACTNCGRCQDACPAYATSKPLSPRKLVQDLKTHMLQAAANPLSAPPADAPPPDPMSIPNTLVGTAPTEDEIWACTTCGACQATCPAYVEHPLKVIDMRRNLVLAQNKMPETAQVMLRNMQSRGHPWAGAQALRLRGDWIAGLDVKVLGEGMTADTLLWVGCTGALVDRNVAVTLAMVKILKAAGVDFGVLGEAETCCGDPARRVGYEFQFQLMAEQNIEAFKTYQVKQIVTPCPHCYNTLKNEYSRLGANLKVVHHTELIADLLQQGRLNPVNELKAVLSYHDPCYLGRYNGVYTGPRQALKSISGVQLEEMWRSHEKSFCCGGGGGHMWVEEQAGTKKINEERVEDFIKTGAGTAVTACPYCLQMFEEGIDHKGMKENLAVKDIAELVEAAIKKP